MSDSPLLVDFVIGLVNSIFNVSNREVKVFGGIRITEELLVKLVKFLIK